MPAFRRASIACSAALALAHAAAGAAQDFSPAIDPGIVAGIAGQRATQIQAERMARGRAFAPMGGPAGSAVIGGLADVLALITSGAAAPASGRGARLTYTPTPALRQHVV